MFDELKKFKEKDHFFIRENDDLLTVCNAPSKDGVYLIYSLNRGRIEMVFIGCTDISSPFQGLRDQIVSREDFFISKIKEEGAEALDVYWYVTAAGKKVYNPKETELGILLIHAEIHGSLPRWNR